MCSGKYKHTGIYCTCGLLFLASHAEPRPPVTLMHVIQRGVRFSKHASKNNNAILFLLENCLCTVTIHPASALSRKVQKTLCSQEHVLMTQLMLKLSRRMHFTHGRLWKVMGSSVLDQVAHSSLKNVTYSLFNPIFLLTTCHL